MSPPLLACRGLTCRFGGVVKLNPLISEAKSLSPCLAILNPRCGGFRLTSQLSAPGARIRKGKRYSRRQLLASAASAASRVGS
jgi:hypothetical protein